MSELRRRESRVDSLRKGLNPFLGLFIDEIIEWLTALVFGGDLGIAYLGTQGDSFDPIKDMALAGSGSVITMAITFLVILRYDPRQYWNEIRQSARIDKTLLGEEALQRMRKK
jgi:putative membrane protein